MALLCIKWEMWQIWMDDHLSGSNNEMMELNWGKEEEERIESKKKKRELSWILLVYHFDTKVDFNLFHETMNGHKSIERIFTKDFLHDPLFKLTKCLVDQYMTRDWRPQITRTKYRPCFAEFWCPVEVVWIAKWRLLNWIVFFHTFDEIEDTRQGNGREKEKKERYGRRVDEIKKNMEWMKAEGGRRKLEGDGRKQRVFFVSSLHPHHLSFFLSFSVFSS